MSDEMVMELYSKDISRIKLPPLSDKVRQAMREKKESREEPPANPEHHTAAPKSHRSIPIKFIFAALLTFLVASIPIIVILTKNTLAPVVPEGSGITDISSDPGVSDAEPPAPAVSANALDRIKEQQLNGVVSLSAKGAEELESLLLTYSDNSQVYEDESFIYNFDSSGNLIELVNKSPVDESGVSVSEQEIREKTLEVMAEYYPEWEDGSYDLKIKDNEGGYPKWAVSVSRIESDLSKEIIMITFDSIGNIRRVIVSIMGDNVGTVSKSDAVKIALKEMQSSKYGLPFFQTDDVEIRVEVKYYDEKSYYRVFFSDVVLDDEFRGDVNIKIDPVDGKVLEINF